MDEPGQQVEAERTQIADAAFDVFISYNRRDSEVVDRVATALRRVGIRPWIDTWSGTPGGAWQDEITDGLARSRSCAILIGPHDIGGWGRLELAVALDRATRDAGFRVFPVLLPGLDRFDPNTLPPLLRTRTWVDLRPGPDSTRALDDLARAVRGLPFGAQTAEPLPGRCPYRGLQSFEEEHAELFHGREGDVQRLLEQLRAGRFLAVVGPSGSGKSSLVRAGLIPALRAGALPGSDRWRTSVVRPGTEPLTSLAIRLLDLAGDPSMQATIDALANDPRTLHLCAQAAADGDPGVRILFVVDQFEELFTLSEDEASRREFLDNLDYATTVPGGPSVVVVTMRADLYGRLAAYPATAQLASAHHFLVGSLDQAGLRDAIEQPARSVGLDLEPGLADVILDDFAAEPGGLPLLEHALLETWRHQRGGILTLADYRDTGRVSGALAERAETVYQQLPANHRRIARRLLLRLTHPGEKSEDTRRRASFEELVTDPTEREQVEAVVRELAEARLLTTGGDVGAGTWVDVAHEALIRGWPRLRGWLDEERTALLLHRKLTDAANDWQRAGRDRGLLLRGRRLDEALSLRATSGEALNDAERALLAASMRVRRGRRAAAMAALAVLLLAVVWAARPRIQETLWQRAAARRGPMVSFPAGPAVLGGRGEEGRRRARTVVLGAFRLDRYEVANEQYRLCVRAERCTLPLEPASDERPFSRLDGRLPVVNVTARQAAAFCRWLGRRLPSEAEWERAARGARGRSWPWGEARPTARHVNAQMGDRRPRPLARVDDPAFRRGSTPEGVAHMVGNVREFTGTPLRCKPDPYACRSRWNDRAPLVSLVTRGAGFEEAPEPVIGGDVQIVDSGIQASEDLGFRCARSV